MIDRELVTRKLALIVQDLPALTELAEKSLAEYLANPIHEVLSDRMIDVNYHLITELGHAPPRDYHESFVELGKLTVSVD